MTATRTRKQTAGNNPLLARVKRTFNHKVYALALAAMNDGRGEAGVREAVGRVVIPEVADRFMAGSDRPWAGAASEPRDIGI